MLNCGTPTPELGNLLFERSQYISGFIMPKLDVTAYSTITLVAYGRWAGRISIAGSADGINYSVVNVIEAAPMTPSVELAVDTEGINYLRATLLDMYGPKVTLKAYGTWLEASSVPPVSGT